MPKKTEDELRKSGKKKGLKGEALESYIYGTMNKMGLMKGSKRKAKKKPVKSAAMKKKK